MGGKRWTYEKGGFREFKGPSHAEGGIPYKGVEVEGGETEVQVDGSPYVLSNRIINPGTGNSVAKDSSRLHRALNGRTDVISENTLKISDKQLSNINESFKGIQNFMDSVSTKKMALGGPGEPPTKTNYPPSVYVDPLSGIKINSLDYSALTNTPIAQNALDSALFPNKFQAVGPQQNINVTRINPNALSNTPTGTNAMNTSMINTDIPQTLPSPPSVSASGISGNFAPLLPTNMRQPGIHLPPMTNQNPGSTQNGVQTANGLFSNMTTGDKVQLAATAIPAIANIGRGIFGKAERVAPNYNEYNQSMLNRAGRMNVDYQSMLNQDNLATNALRETIRNGTNSSSVARSNLQQAYANQAERRADIKLKEQMAQNDLNKYRNQLEGQIGSANVQAEELARRETAANLSAKTNLITQGLGDLAEAGVRTGKGLNTGLFNERTFQALQSMYPNFTMGDYQEFIKSGMNFTDFIKYKGY